MTDLGLSGSEFLAPRAAFPGRDGEAVAPVPARAGVFAPALAMPLLAILIFNLADVATTHRILGMGGRELNPVAGWLLANGWLLAAKLGLVALIAALSHAAPPRRWVPTALWVMAGLYGSVIAFHLAQLAIR